VVLPVCFLQRQCNQISESPFGQGILAGKEAVVGFELDFMPSIHGIGQQGRTQFSCQGSAYLIFEEKQIYAVAGALVMVLSRSTLRIYANVASEPLFVTFMLIFFFAAARYFKDDSRSMLWLMFVSAGLATLQRYLGVILIGVGGLVVLFKDGWRRLPRAILPALTAALPIALWGVFHNLPLSGGLFGPRNFGTMLPLENINLSLTKILWWFMPLTPPLR